MRLETVNHLVSFVGTFSEKKKIEFALSLMAKRMSDTIPAYFDNSYAPSNECDIGFAYDQSAFTIKDIRFFWREIKKTHAAALSLLK